MEDPQLVEIEVYVGDGKTLTYVQGKLVLVTTRRSSGSARAVPAGP